MGERLVENAVASVSVAVLHSIGGCHDNRCRNVFAAKQAARAHTRAYLEGFLRRFAGADGDESWASHAAEALQVQRPLHRHRRHGKVLQREKKPAAGLELAAG